MSQRERVTRAKSARSTAPARLLADGQTQMAPWRTLITAVHPHRSVKINHGATFLVTDQRGAIPHGSEGEYGLYDSDTRFVSRHELRLNGKRARLGGVGKAFVSPRALAYGRRQHRGPWWRHARGTRGADARSFDQPAPDA
ncbi:MAG: hypothetical protein E6I96_03605 [Chloroflexi bacterium]|nr:MAG: hypothetical protein E6I96_03605 [Chloroflexota bacterium]